jgi:hypothetical protein
MTYRTKFGKVPEVTVRLGSPSCTASFILLRRQNNSSCVHGPSVWSRPHYTCLLSVSSLHNIVICRRHNRIINDTLRVIKDNDHLSLSSVLYAAYFNGRCQNYFLESLLLTGQDNLKT